MNNSMGFFSIPAPPASKDIKPMNLMENAFRRMLPVTVALLMAIFAAPLHGPSLVAQQIAPPGAAPIAAPVQQPHAAGGEANLVIPDLSTVDFFGVHGTTLL